MPPPWWTSLGQAYNSRPWLRRSALAAAWVAPVLFFLRGYLPHPTYVGAFGDIINFHFWWDVSRRSVVEYGQLPFWNPYYCGGMVHWANVQTMFLSPSFIFNVIGGPGVGIRAHIFLHFIGGFIGCWMLSRQQGIKGPWAFACGVVFIFGGNLAERSTGHLSFMPFALVPWLLYFFDRAREDLRFVAPLAGVVAYSVLAGGPYPFVMSQVYVGALLLLETGRRIWGARQTTGEDPSSPNKIDLRWPLQMGLLFGALTLTVAAVKLFVVMDFMSEYPRVMTERDALSLAQVWDVFLDPTHARRRAGYFYVFGEYRNYLGPAAMIAVPLMLWQWRQRWRDYALIGIFVALMVGHVAPWAPFALLSELPVFKSLRVPVRYAIFVDLHIGLLFGHLLSQLARRASSFTPRWRLVAQAGLGLWFLACAGDLMTQNNRQTFNFFRHSPEAQTRAGDFRMIRGNPGHVFHAPIRNEGHIRCYEPNPLAISSHLKPLAPSEVYLAEGPGEVAFTEWTPNRLEVHAQVHQPSTVVINMNHHRDWRAAGGTVRAWKGLLAVDIPAGEHQLTLRYQPRRFWLYLALTLLGLAASFWIGLGRTPARWLRPAPPPPSAPEPP